MKVKTNVKAGSWGYNKLTNQGGANSKSKSNSTDSAS
jgi:hypothetical protein